MAHLIDKDVLLAEIEKKKIPFKRDIENGCYPTYLCALMDFEDFINTLEVKEADNMPNIRFPHYKSIVEKVFGIGNLESFEYSEAEQLVSLAKEELLKDLEVKDVDLEK